jgi:trehalose 6-phosphate phosphatase
MDGPAPPLLDPARHALFLDFDGSLVDFALLPEKIVVRPDTIALLDATLQRLDGALAIVTGRRIANIDQHLAPLKLPAAGVHGLEFRARASETRRTPVSEELEEARRRLMQELSPNDPIYVEDKHGALVLHYRMHPEQELRARRVAEHVTDGLDTLTAVSGHSIFEIRQRDITKANAVRRFMRRPPFEGRVPIFVGDDLTDEDGMRAAAALGGFGVKIGEGDTSAAFRLSDTMAVHGWISQLSASDLTTGTAIPTTR